ncbi:MAG: phosphatase PAP2 family protein [Actinomycetota bacterium]|nr:phosphatase PAP2 family protein [Actinomycetota bacterium]
MPRRQTIVPEALTPKMPTGLAEKLPDSLTPKKKPLDLQLFTSIHDIPSNPTDPWITWLSQAANKGKIWIVIALLLGLRKGPTRRAALRAMGSLWFSSALSNGLIKPIFRRVRPVAYPDKPLARTLRRAPRTFSFPSGHSSSAAAFATGVALEAPLVGAAISPVALAVGYSRIRVGVHYPGDVAAGFAIGATIALASQHWWKVRPARPAKVRTTQAAPSLPRGAGMVIAVNPNSGGATPDRIAEIQSALPEAEIVEMAPDSLLADVLDEVAGRAKALGVAGGDGTVAAAAAIAIEHDLPLAVFPAGTLNHFAADVGITSIEDVVAGIEAGEAVRVDVAEVGGIPFLNTASIGAYPEMIRRRDALAPRLGKWPSLVIAAAQVLRNQKPISVELNGAPLCAWIVFVGNCSYTPRGLSPAWRPRLEDGLLDVQYLRADTKWSRSRTVLTQLFGITEHTGLYRDHLVKDLRVRSLSGPQEIARDGEPAESATEFHFRKHPRQLIVYRPHDL